MRALWVSATIRAILWLMSTTQSRNARCAAFVAGAPYAAVFSNVPSGDSAGTEPSGSTRQPLTWSTPVNGVSTATGVFSETAGTSTQGYGYFSAATNGNYFDGGALSAQQTFSANGQLTVTFTHTEL